MPSLQINISIVSVYTYKANTFIDYFVNQSETNDKNIEIPILSHPNQLHIG